MKRKDPHYEPVSQCRQEVPKTGYSFYLRYSRTLPQRAQFVARSLAVLNTAFATLFADDNFVTLLRAESVTIPTPLLPLLEEQVRRSDEFD